MKSIINLWNLTNKIVNRYKYLKKKSILSSICKGKKLLGNRVPANRKHCQFLLEMIFVGVGRSELCIFSMC